MASSKGTTEGVQLVTAGLNAGHDIPPTTKTVVLQRVSNGFGFTLRHFVVYPPEVVRPSTEGGRVNGVDAAEPMKPQPIDTVFVRQVAPSGPADKAGLSSGDQIVAVNGNQVLNKTYSQVIELIQKSRDHVELSIVPKEECVLQMVNPMITASPGVKTSTPPATKPKPSRTSPGEATSAPGKVMSSVTISTSPADGQWKNASFTLKLSDNTTKSSSGHDTDKGVVTRRGSVDRTAQENRNFVITSDNKEDDANNNNQNGDPNQGSQMTGQNQSQMEGTFFFAATDYTGKPKALHFQRGAAVGDTLKVVEDQKNKYRSRSLPSVEMGGFPGWKEGIRKHHHTLPQQNGPELSIEQNSLQFDIGESNGNTANSNRIPQFTLSAPRTVASDSPSTVNISTNSEFSSRQPIAREPIHWKLSAEGSTSRLIRTISSHMHQERVSTLKSSTMEATLLESKPERKLSDTTGMRTHGSFEEPQPAKIPRQADATNQQLSFSNQVSTFPNQTPKGISLQLKKFPVSENNVFRVQMPAEEDGNQEQSSVSCRQRRTSYLMATGSAPKSPPVKTWSSQGSVKKKKPTLSSALSSSFITPMMVHVSTGTEVCRDTPKEGQFMDSDEIFVEGESGDNDTLVPRLGRRVSYVMATSTPSSPTSPGHQSTFEGMKEDSEEDHPELVHGMMEVSKEGFLWKKLAVTGGGKRSSARSWKSVFAVLRGHVIYFHKDKETAHQGDSAEEQQPISIKSSIVDIAHDYTKRKNVFRLTTFNGSEFLFQAEDRESMMTWIAAMQANNNPDEDESGVTSQSLIIRRMRTVEQDSTGNNQTPPVHKLSPGTGAKLPNFSNLKKSLSFRNISGSQKESGKNHQWHKGSKKRKKPPPPATNFTQGQSIGVPLEVCPASRNNKFVPLLVDHCCEVVETKGIESIGVYRVPGNSAAVSALHEELNTRGADNINFQDEKWYDINNITSLLKQFLRKLPEGLVTAELYDGFVEANRKEDPVERMWALKCLVSDLPEHNYETMKFLLAHLKYVSQNSDKNKMEGRNLAIVFGPTLVRTGEDTMMSMVKDMSDQCRIVETLLTHNEWFFEVVSGEGDDVLPTKPPVDAKSPQEQFVSMSVLSSLGQAAGNFNEDGNTKSKTGPPANILLHIPKFRSKQSKSESHDGTPPDVFPPDGSVSPGVERGPPVLKITASGSCPGSPTRLGPKRSGELSSLSTGSMASVVEMIDSDSRTRGTSSLKAYSYARPPPPSYRKVGPPKRPNSPPVDQQESSQVNVTFGVIPSEPVEVPKADNESTVDTESSPAVKPNFASLSEETRLRLLKVSLQQKAAEKKRQLDSPTNSVAPTLTDMNGELPADLLNAPQKLSEHVSDSTEHLSSSSTSRSSSTPSSKNASLDSLHLPPQGDSGGVAKTGGRETARVTGSGGWKASLTPITTSTPTTAPSNESQTSETVLTIVQGKGVVSSGNEATRRPSSLDIRARRITAEGLRLKTSLQSESSDSSSDEGELALSMSKTFDEKLRILLDLDYPFKGDGRKKDENEEEVASISSEHQQASSLGGRSDSESFEDLRGSNASLASSSSERRSSFDRLTEPRRPSLERSHFVINKPPESSDTKATIQIESKGRQGSHSKQMASRLQPETWATRPRSARETTKTEIRIDKDKPTRKSEGSLISERQSPSKIGKVHTTTPVALKEFKTNFRKEHGDKRDASVRQPVTASPPRGIPPKNAYARMDSPYVTSKTESSFVKPKTEKTSIMVSPRNSIGSPRGSFAEGSPRNSSAESSPRNSRSEMSINLSSVQKKPGPGDRKATGKYAAMAARSHVAPKVMGRESGTKPKTYPNKDSHRDILPSRSTYGTAVKEPGRGKHAHNLETNAQHIEDLLKEMHSERHLKMSRQRSDISGQAQKAAAQRAGVRRRRRSLGDENHENVTKAGSARDERESREEAPERIPQATRDVPRRRRTEERPEERRRAHRNLLKTSR